MFDEIALHVAIGFYKVHTFLQTPNSRNFKKIQQYYLLIFKDTYTECIRINQGKPDIILGQKIKAGQFILNNSALQSRK